GERNDSRRGCKARPSRCRYRFWKRITQNHARTIEGLGRQLSRTQGRCRPCVDKTRRRKIPARCDLMLRRQRMETTSPIAHRLRSRWLLAAAVISLTSGPSTATSLGGAVSIGPQKVDELKLIQAVAECSLNAPEFTRTKCVDTFWVPRWLLDAEANDAKLRDTPGMQRMASRLLYQGLDKKLRQSAA